MYQALWNGDPDKTDGLKFSAKKIGSLTVEHNHGNTKSWCTFDNWDSISSKYGYKIYADIIGYTRKKAIQSVLENIALMDIPIIISDIIFDNINFYKFAYLDYISRIESINPNEEKQSTLKLNDWLDCDTCHCIQSDHPFRCDYMIETKRACFESGHPVCKYFQALKGSIEVTA
jgi:hypothetical protein